jgi:hypothetical protein
MAKSKLEMPRKHPPDEFHARPFYKVPRKPVRLDKPGTQPDKPAAKRKRKE